MTTTYPSSTGPLDKVLMKCGHAANAIRAVDAEREEWIPACTICDCIEQVETPDLTNREAICCSADTITPSSTNLAFFEYRGPGSPAATDICVCGYRKIAHERKFEIIRLDGRPVNPHICDHFQPQGPYERDAYYCGCRGWD